MELKYILLNLDGGEILARIYENAGKTVVVFLSPDIPLSNLSIYDIQAMKELERGEAAQRIGEIFEIIKDLAIGKARV